jgi:hypothetical protein
MRRSAVMLGAAVVLGVGAAAASAVIPNADGNIYACYSNGDGSVRVKNDPAAPCPRNWSPLQWASKQPVTTTYSRLNHITLEDAGQELVDVFCDDGDVATGGGHGIGTRPGSGTGELGALLNQSNPISDSDDVPFGWRVNVNGAEGVSINAWVVCQHTE